MRPVLCLILIILALPAGAERDAELDALLGEAGVSDDEEKTEKKALKPLFVIPFQPIWNSVEPDVVEEAFKHIAGVLKEDVGYEVRLFRQRGRLEKGADPSARVAQKYHKEMAYGETLLKLKRPGRAVQAAKPVLRKMWQNARHLRGSDSYCRCLAILAEASLSMGQKKPATTYMDELVTRCDGAFYSTTSLTYSKRFEDLVKERSEAKSGDRSSSLTIYADLPKAKILINGLPLGSAPLTITNLPAGRHLVGVIKKDHRAWGATPVLKPGENLELRATVTRGLEDKGLRAMYGTLRDNRIDRDVLRQATQMLRSQGKGAELGILGVLGRQGSKIRMTLFGFNRKGRAMRLKQADFGQDFLMVNLAMVGVGEKLTELQESGGRALIAGEPLISGLAKGSWTPRTGEWVAIRDRARLAAGIKAKNKEPTLRGPLVRRKKKDEVPAPTADGVPTRIERAGQPSTAKPNKEDKAAAAAEAAAVKAAREKRQAEGQAREKKLRAQASAREKAEREAEELEQTLLEKERAALAKKRAEEAAKEAVVRKQQQDKYWEAVMVWQKSRPSQWLFGLSYGQSLADGGGVGDLSLSFSTRRPAPLRKLHWRAGARIGVSTSKPEFSDDRLFKPLEFPFLDVTRDSEDLAEAFRYDGGIRSVAGIRGTIDYEVMGPKLLARLDLELGVSVERGDLVHEQFIVDAGGERVRNSGVELRRSSAFSWMGSLLAASLGLEYVHQTDHRFSLNLCYVEASLNDVESFGTVLFPGELEPSSVLEFGYSTNF